MTDLVVAPGGQTPRGALRLLLDGAFAAVFWGRLTSAMGVWMHSLVAVVVVYEVSGSATVVSLVSLGQFAPQLLFAPLTGKWADRGDMARLIILGQLMCVVGSLGVALIVWRELTPGVTIAGVFVFTLLSGIGLVVSGPSMQAIVPGLIRPGELSTAMALGTFPNNFGRLAGPALGAFAIVTLHASAAFVLGAALHGLMVLVMLRASFPEAAQRVEDGASDSVRAGLRYVRQHRGLRLMLWATLAVAVAAEPSITLAPALSEHVSGGDALVGWLSGGFGLGAFVGSLIALVVPRFVWVRVSATAGLVVLGLGTGLTGLLRDETWAVTCFVVAGFGFALAMAGFSTLIQAHVSPEYRGRVMALWLIAFVGARPLAAVVVGLLTDLGGIAIAFAGAGLVVLAAVWATRPSALGPRVETA